MTKRKIVFATNNIHKLEEAKSILGCENIEILSLEDIGCKQDIPETADTLEGNALIKAHFVFDKFKTNCFADDTGLEVEALNGAPGVHSARYAYENIHDSQANIEKLLKELKGKDNRQAQFRTVISYISSDNEIKCFEGIVRGKIISVQKGNFGFGYDSVFMPDGYDKTFAELGEEIKNTISHRARALEKFSAYLKSK